MAISLRSEHAVAQIKAAFDEFATSKSHGACVQGCQSDYQQCAKAGNICRDELQACIQGCPDGLAADQVTRLLKRLAEIDAEA